MPDPIVAIDVDGVVADLITTWLNRYNKDYSDNVLPSHIINWNFSNLVKCGTNIFKYIQDPTTYDSVNPIIGSKEAIELLRNYFRVIFVTSSTVGTLGRKFHWLVQHGYLEEKELKNYVECSDKNLIKADLLIDDYFGNISSFPNHTILFDQPWNKHEHHDYRLNGWDLDQLKTYLIKFELIF